jgi:hypothetical protein
MIIKNPEDKKELDKIPNADENGDPIYKIDDLSEESIGSGSISAIGHYLQSIIETGKNSVDIKARNTSEPSVFINSMTAPVGEKLMAVNILTRKLVDAKEVTICDPYFFIKPEDEKDNEYIESLISVLPLKSLKKVNIFHQNYEIDILRNFRRRIQSHNILINIYRTKTIHDRVWIVEGKKAFVVGTSFQSLGGNKFSFILDLPDEDLETFNIHLQKERVKNTRGN